MTRGSTLSRPRVVLLKVLAGVAVLAARRLGVPLRPARAVGDTYRAQFLNSVLPAGVLGDVHRAVDHGRLGGLPAVRGRWTGALRTGLREVRSGVLSRGAWPAVVALSVAGLAVNLVLFVVAARTAGVLVPLSELVPLLVAVLQAMVLPLNVGGWGPREATAAYRFGAAGYGAAQGLTVAVVFGVLALVSCLPGALVLLRRPAPDTATC